MEAPPDFKTLQEQIQSALVATTRTVNQISAEDLAFHRSLNREVGEELDQKSNRLLEVAQSLLKSAASVSSLSAPELQDVDDVENNWRGVVDVVDSLLEKADTCLDEYTGVIKRKGTGVTEEPNSKKQHPSQLGRSFRNQNLLKPQLGFDYKPQNFDSTPWKPLLTSKPHALVPLEESLGSFTDQLEHEQYDYKIFLPHLKYSLEPFNSPDFANLTPEELAKSQEKRKNRRLRKFESLGEHTNTFTRFRHPYEAEILHLQYPESVYRKADPIKYLPFETTTATWVDTFEGVREMLEELKGATEIAVDLEHHDTRSYIGLVSLMQISTRSKDWVVDTLKPWRQDLQILNEVFTNPKIVKVFHGAYMDIVWLQRDLGLYVTGLFDTHHASRALGYPGGSLAYLLKRFIDFDADKKYQMADWRIRPLPEEMFFYARSDTHFLLYIYDNMRNELVDKSDPTIPENNRVEIVLQKSKETSLMCYKKDIYELESGKGPGGWFTLLSKTPQIQTSEQLAIFRAVHAWRDRVARMDDDSVNYVMSNQTLVSISKRAPIDITSLYGVIHPISHNVKSRINELLDIIKEAKANGVDGPTAMDILKPGTMGAMAKQIRESNKADMAASSSTNLPSATAFPKTDAQGLLRSETSKFWGGAFGSSIWDTSVSTLGLLRESITLAVPMPQLSSDIFSSRALVTGNSLQTPNATETTSKADANEKMMQADKLMFPSRNEDDSAFVIRRGLKRKSDSMASGGDLDEDMNKDIIALDEADEVLQKRRQNQQKKHDRKAEKRELKERRKKARRESRQSFVPALETEDSKNVDMAKQAVEGDSAEAEAEKEDDEEEEEDEEEDFDYSKAKSVLHSKSRGGGAGFAGKKEKKGNGKGGSSTPFDPYTKSANAAKGMRRQQSSGDGDKGGRSMTFRK